LFGNCSKRPEAPFRISVHAISVAADRSRGRVEFNPDAERLEPIVVTEVPLAASPECFAMRLQTYRDEAQSRHLHLISEGRRPWSIDLVSATASGILVVGFVCALVVPWV
jgi:hypothetical protein